MLRIAPFRQAVPNLLRKRKVAKCCFCCHTYSSRKSCSMESAPSLWTLYSQLLNELVKKPQGNAASSPPLSLKDSQPSNSMAVAPSPSRIPRYLCSAWSISSQGSTKKTAGGHNLHVNMLLLWHCGRVDSCGYVFIACCTLI